jgi:hypothetical protein
MTTIGKRAKERKNRQMAQKKNSWDLFSPFAFLFEIYYNCPKPVLIGIRTLNLMRIG